MPTTFGKIDILGNGREHRVAQMVMNNFSNGDFSRLPDTFVGNIIGAFSRALSDKMDRAVREAAGLSNSACCAIVTIGSEPNSCIETLRRMLSLEHSSLVRLIDRMEKQGLLQRIRGTGKDLREVKVSLTDRGETYFTIILEARRNVLAKTLEPLTHEERQLFSSIIFKLMPSVVEGGYDQHYVCRLCDLESCPQENCPVNLAYPDLFELPEKPFKRIQQCNGNQRQKSEESKNNSYNIAN